MKTEKMLKAGMIMMVILLTGGCYLNFFNKFC